MLDFSTEHTQTRCEQSYVEVRHELLLVCIEHSLPRNDVSWQSNTYYFHHRFEYQEYEMAKGWMGFVVVYSPCEEGERGGGNRWSVIACNNRIESVGRRMAEDPHLVVRIDGLDRVFFEGEEECSLSEVVVEGLKVFERLQARMMREPVLWYLRVTGSIAHATEKKQGEG